MYRFVVLVLGAVAVGAHPRYGEMPACARLSHIGLQCCKRDIPEIQPPSDDIKECFQLKKKPPSCDVEICIAKKNGLVSDDGTFDKKKMAEGFEKKFESDPELVDNIKDNCINGDLSKFGPSDVCYLRKQKNCIEVQMIKGCEWNDEGNCSGMKDVAAECLKEFS